MEALVGGQTTSARVVGDALRAANAPALPVVVAKAVGIANPKRICVMRKQLRGRCPGQLLTLLAQVLKVEEALKRGAEPGEAFRAGFLMQGTGA